MLLVACGYVLHPAILFPGVPLSIVAQSFLVKTLFKFDPVKVRDLADQYIKSTPSSLLETTTFNITYDTRSSELYLKESFNPTGMAQYSLRVYQPKLYREGGYPVIMFIHGGGWLVGNLDMYDLFCNAISERGFVVVSVGYRRTPENPFPACLNDNLNALSWIGKHLRDERFNANLNQLTISGDSAGGHLSIHTQVRTFLVDQKVLERESIPNISYQALLYPVVEFYSYGDVKYSSYASFSENGILIDGHTMDMFWKYLTINSTREEISNNPYVSVLSAVDSSDKKFYSQFKPGFIWTAEYDVLRDEGEAFTRAVNEANGPKLLHTRWPQCFHGFASVFSQQKHTTDYVEPILNFFKSQ